MKQGDKVKATPAKGVSFRKPDGKPLDPNGETVVYNSFWRRRERDGDVTLTAIKTTKTKAQE